MKDMAHFPNEAFLDKIDLKDIKVKVK